MKPFNEHNGMFIELVVLFSSCWIHFLYYLLIELHKVQRIVTEN